MKTRELMRKTNAAKHITAVLVALSMIITLAMADAECVNAASTSPSSAEQICLNGSAGDEFSTEEDYLSDETHWYSFTTDSSGSAYVVTAEYTYNNVDASNDGLSITVTDNCYNGIEGGKMWLSAPGNADRVTLNLDSNKTYYVSVNTAWTSMASVKGYTIGVMQIAGEESEDVDEEEWIEEESEDVDEEEWIEEEDENDTEEEWVDEEDENDNEEEWIDEEDENDTEEEWVDEEDENDTEEEWVDEEDEDAADEDELTDEDEEDSDEETDESNEEADNDEQTDNNTEINDSRTDITDIINIINIKAVKNETINVIERVPVVNRVFERIYTPVYTSNPASSNNNTNEKKADDKNKAVNEVSYAAFDGSRYELVYDEATGIRTASLIEAANTKKLVMPATVSDDDGMIYKVNGIKTGAFSDSEAEKLVIKSKNIAKPQVRGSLYGSEIRTVRVRPSFLFFNWKYVKSYKNCFTKDNCGKEVRVW